MKDGVWFCVVLVFILVDGAAQRWFNDSPSNWTKSLNIELSVVRLKQCNWKGNTINRTKKTRQKLFAILFRLRWSVRLATNSAPTIHQSMLFFYAIELNLNWHFGFFFLLLCFAGAFFNRLHAQELFEWKSGKMGKRREKIWFRVQEKMSVTFTVDDKYLFFLFLSFWCWRKRDYYFLRSFIVMIIANERI